MPREIPDFARWNDTKLSESRLVARGPRTKRLELRLATTTPMFGGGVRARELDLERPIRSSAVRGHLRFWWRALHAHAWPQSAALFEHEVALWGGLAAEGPKRSQVDVRVNCSPLARLQINEQPPGDVEGYALWPAREKGPPAWFRPRAMPGLAFTLELTYPAQAAIEEDLLRTLRAWILFGGYGSRTRRGVGSLTVVSREPAWLPAGGARKDLGDYFGLDVFAQDASAAGETPRLAGAALHTGARCGSGQSAWEAALSWLREFRQGVIGEEGERAREPSAIDPRRPKRSNWPEPDKVRHLSNPLRGLPWAHEPRHNSTPAWPRAGFGLPIVGKFQDRSRESDPGDATGRRTLKWEQCSPPSTEPSDYKIVWRDTNGVEQDRLASPLIVKAMPLAGGEFLPCALWLDRAHPAGDVALEGKAGSAAPFDRLVASGDKALFGPLARSKSLRHAFLAWLGSSKHTTEVAP